MYEYSAKMLRVIDGDTLEVDIDLGFKTILRKKKLRLSGIDTPELRSKDITERARAKEAKQFVESLIKPGDTIMIRTFRDRTGKYGRCIATVWLKVDDRERSLTSLLLENNHKK